MKSLRLLLAAITCLLSLAVIAQDSNAVKSQGKGKTEGLKKITQDNDSRAQGLTRIDSHRDEDWEDRFDVDMDEINATVEAAMKSVDRALRHIDIPATNIQVPRIVIPAMDMGDIHIPEIEIPEIDIDIPEIRDLEIDHDHIDSDRHHHHHFRHDADRERDDSGKDKAKTKGLKKIK